MRDRPTVPLGRLVEIKHGHAFRGEYFSRQPTGAALITPGNFALEGGFLDRAPKYYSGPVAEEYRFRGGELVVTMTDLSKAGDTLGYAAIVPEDLGYVLLHNQRIGLVTIKDRRRADKNFLHWLLRSPWYRRQVLATASGTTVRHTSPERICAIRAPLPPLDEQRRIAAVLDAVEDRIRGNRALGRTLEDTVHALFRSRFVDFAGHGDLVDSEIGPIPRGWRVRPVTELVEFNPRVPLLRGTVTKYIDMRGLSASTAATSVSGVREFRGSGSRFERDDVLMARITPCLENGKTGLVAGLSAGEVAVGSTEFIVMRGRSYCRSAFVYCLARSREFRAHAISHMTGSSGRQRVPVNCLEHYLLAVPSRESMLRFEDIASPMLRRIFHGESESETLAEIRELLLPGLISGELRVREAETIVDCMLNPGTSP